MIWLYGDPHWHHANIVRLCGRPFKDVDEMNRALITNYNAVVKPDDEVYFMGDVGWKDTQKVVNILHQLVPAKKYLLIGNHDLHNINNQNFVDCFEWMKDLYELKYNNRLYVLCHYPMFSWHNSGKSTYSRQLHSHTHGNIEKANETVCRLDCGVDVHNFAPISIDQVETIMAAKTVTPHW